MLRNKLQGLKKNHPKQFPKKLMGQLGSMLKKLSAWERRAKNMQSNLERLIKNAVLQKDYSTLQDMADAVMFFKFQDPNKAPMFPIHYKILKLRQELELAGKTMTVRQVAEHLKGGDAGKSDDGFRNLRRLCKKLHFPLKTVSRKSQVVHKKKAEQRA